MTHDLPFGNQTSSSILACLTVASAGCNSDVTSNQHAISTNVMHEDAIDFLILRQGRLSQLVPLFYRGFTTGASAGSVMPQNWINEKHIVGARVEEQPHGVAYRGGKIK